MLERSNKSIRSKFNTGVLIEIRRSSSLYLSQFNFDNTKLKSKLLGTPTYHCCFISEKCIVDRASYCARLRFKLKPRNLTKRLEMSTDVIVRNQGTEQE